MAHTFGATWTSFALDFPLTQREQHANRTVGARRLRTSRRLKATFSLPSAPIASERANPIVAQPQL